MPCPDGAPCTVDETCASLVCDQDTLFCVAARCGDSRVNGNEVCDTGGVSTAFCDADCTIPACNDGIFNPRAEACESNSVATTTCDPDCTIPECNDGIFNPFTEICDEGGDTPTCDADCSLPSCGDFHVNPQFNNEECDEGGLVSATCDSDCTLPRCGDGLLNPWPARSSTRR